jgi:hypothetical protein
VFGGNAQGCSADLYGVDASHVENLRRALLGRHALHYLMGGQRVAVIAMLILFAISAKAANPFLDARDDNPVSTSFRGTEWGDNIDEDEIPLTARVVTTRIAKMQWGAIFKIEFTDLKSSASEPRKIKPEYFIATDDRIVLLSEEDIPAAIKRISALEKPPEFEPGEIYGITGGSFNHEDGPWKTTINMKGDLCVYEGSHPSGHFKKVVWKKGVGLVEYASGYGARSDGYRLKRVTEKLSDVDYLAPLIWRAPQDISTLVGGKYDFGASHLSCRFAARALL